MVTNGIVYLIKNKSIQYKKVVVPGKDEINLASNAATWQK
jgi:hypothetical protein